MRKSLWIFGILAVFAILTLSGLVSAYHSPDCDDGYIDDYKQYNYNYGYGYDGYSDTYYKKKTYYPYGKTIVIKRDNPYKSYYGHTTYNYGYYGYGYHNPLYNYLYKPYGYYNYPPYDYQHGYGYSGYY